MTRLAGKVAVITGAARGVGRAHAVRFAEEGAKVLAIDIKGQVGGTHVPQATSTDLQETVRLVEAGGGSIIGAEADVRDLPALEAAVAQAREAFGSIDVVCANAAINSFGASWELPPETWQSVIDVNLTGSWNTVRSCVPAMIEGGRGGSIVFVNSVNGLKAGPNISHYASSKHGVVGLMRSLAAELGKHSIRANTVHPTMVATDMAINEAAFRRYLPGKPDANADDLAALMLARHSLPVPWVDAEDIANATIWLSSDEARYVTGATLPVDAGMLVR
jgi:SDR family mycofactocin-dependent oxidoreductase